MSKVKYVMKNKEEKQYYNHNLFPPVVDDVWKAEFFDSDEQARSSLRRFLSEKYNANKFEAVKVFLTEED
jgi:hypothetical protein